MDRMLVPFLTFVAITSLGGAVLSARRAQRKLIEDRLVSSNFSGPAKNRKPRFFKIVGAIGVFVSSGKVSSDLQQELAQAGFHGSNSGAVYLGAKMILLFAGLIIASLAFMAARIRMSVTSQIIVIALVGVALSFIPNMVVKSRRAKRRMEIRHHLPDALDLLEICMSAGMGMDMAWNSVAEEIRRVSATLADEMALSNLEIHLGAPRAVALRHMAERTQEAELNSLVAILVQSEKFGTSIADALRTFAASMRETRSQHAREAAERMAVKLIIPMALFIFPPLFIVTVGPAAVSILKELS